MALTVHLNNSNIDGELNESGTTWVEFSSGNDKMVFCNETDTIADGEAIPSQSQLISAGIELTGSEIVIPNYFLLDLSEADIKEIFLMGNQNARYVWAFDFDSETASEPTLEFYDDTDYDSIDNIILGEADPTSSFLRGITTTDFAPGVDWVGSKLAGSSDGHFLYLNAENGALTGAKTLYCNFKVVVPASQSTGFSANFVWVVKWLDNE